MQSPQEQIETLWKEMTENQRDLSTLTNSEKKNIQNVIEALDKGELRVCTLSSNQKSSPHVGAQAPQLENPWIVHEWIKKSILLYFRIQQIEVLQSELFHFVDKIPLKKWTGQEKVRVVPSALARYGSYIEAGAILMPSYTNIGAYVGAGTMVDTWATVGSCAQIGRNVHLSGGVGIGGVLEPVQAKPVIIEDDVFVGSRCIIVEGAYIQTGAVIGAGVTITGSTKIIDVTQTQAKEYKGFVPARSVVIPGTINKNFAAGNYGVPCALIIGQRSAATDMKTSLTAALRDFQVSV